MAPVTASSVADEVESYLAAMEGILSAKSIRDSYGSPLRRILGPFCQRLGLASTADLTPAHLDQLRVELLRRKEPRPLTDASVRSYLKAINVFLGWTAKARQAPPVSAGLPRLRHRHRDVLSREEMGLLEDAAMTERDKLIIRLAGDYALRLGELATLRTTSLIRQGDDYYLKVEVEGKTGERLVGVEEDFWRRLHAYAARGRPVGARNQLGLFIGLRRRPNGEFEPLGRGAIYQIVKDVARRAGLQKRVHPHLFRHSAITYMVRRGKMSLRAVSEQTGASIQTLLEHYVHEDERSRRAGMVDTLRDEA